MMLSDSEGINAVTKRRPPCTNLIPPSGRGVAGPQATREIRANTTRNTLWVGERDCPVEVILSHALCIRVSPYSNDSILHSDGRSGRQRLPTVDARQFTD